MLRLIVVLHTSPHILDLGSFEIDIFLDIYQFLLQPLLILKHSEDLILISLKFILQTSDLLEAAV